MAKKSEKKAERRNVAKKPLLDEQQKAVAIKVVGVGLCVLTLAMALSALSYLVHWTADAAPVGGVKNIVSKLGASLGGFVVRDCLGLASFVVIGLVGHLAYKTFMRNLSWKMLYSILQVFAGAVLLAAWLAFLGHVFKADALFGGGLGGHMGSAIGVACVNFMGSIMTFVFFVFLTIVWLLFVSKRFSGWFATAFEPREPEADPVVPVMTEPETAPQEETEVIEIPDSEEEPVQESEDPVIVEPQPDDSIILEPETPAVDETEPGEEEDSRVTIVEGDGINTNVTRDLEPFDCKADLENFRAPSLDLLNDYASGVHRVAPSEVENNNNKIRNTLNSFKIRVDHVEAIVGPTVTLYKVFLAEGMKGAAVRNVESDIARALCASGVRVVNLPDSVGIEVPNETKSIVPLKSMFDDDAFRKSKAELPIAIGYTITQQVKVFDLADAPHLLVAGATKQGKSVGLNVIINSLLYAKHPSELKLVFIDPKMVEFSAYGKLLKHYLACLPGYASEEEEKEKVIVKDPKDAEMVLRSLCEEMEQRYRLLSKAGVNQLKDYNKKYSERHLLPTDGHKFLPYLVVVIDEYADLIMMSGGGPEAKNRSRSIANSVIRLAQKGRAAGINVVIATQRPSVDVITGLIKANFPTRIAFKVANRVDSSTIIDSPGAEKLIGRGDMLYYQGVGMERVQCALIGTEEIQRVTKFIGDQTGYKEHYSTPYYLPEPPSDGTDEGGSGGTIDMNKIDENFEEAARMVVLNQKGSTSDLQRRLGMGYSRAGKVMDQLQAAGIVSAQVGSKPREVLVKDFAELEPILDAFLKNR